ncbi:MAG: transcriptional repressor [Bacilli bacterium]|nr:transcriptional repressor [Bacilli bacterium]
MNELLIKHGLKVTNQRIQVLDAINELSVNSTIKNIINKLNIDQSTVYRTLKTLEENNIIEKNVIDDEIIYIIKEEHKHYFKCIKCNKVKELHTCPIEISDELDGCKILNHSLILDGICDNCNK